MEIVKGYVMFSTSIEIRRAFIIKILRYGFVIVVIGITTLLLKLTARFFEIRIIALLFLLPVMISTIAWGLGPGILAAFLSFLAFNYFFIEPFNTLLVHQSGDLFLLFIFLVVSGVMSQLIGKAKQNEQLAKLRERESTRLYELTASLASCKEIASAIENLENHILDAFDCLAVKLTLHLAHTDSDLVIISPDGINLTKGNSQSMEFSRGGIFSGNLSIWSEKGVLTDNERKLLDAFLHQGMNSIERIVLEEKTNRLKVLEESDTVKTSLLNSVSHELRSPLAAIKASISSLRGGSVDWKPEDRKELFATIEEETDHLNFLVGNLLDMTRIDSGSLRPNIRLNSIGEIANTAVQKSRTMLVNHEMILTFPENLPPVPTDYVMMVQVFVNLISNSIKYAPLHSQIQISAGVKGDAIQILLNNQSPRIPEQDLPRIFEKFYRVTAADKTTGTGLGLSICKGIVEAHGGTITAANQDDCFQFIITLPLGTLEPVQREKAD